MRLFLLCVFLFSRVQTTLQSALSVRPLVSWLVPILLFLWFYFSDLTAPAPAHLSFFQSFSFLKIVNNFGSCWDWGFGLSLAIYSLRWVEVSLVDILGWPHLVLPVGEMTRPYFLVFTFLFYYDLLKTPKLGNLEQTQTSKYPSMFPVQSKSFKLMISSITDLSCR